MSLEGGEFEEALDSLAAELAELGTGLSAIAAGMVAKQEVPPADFIGRLVNLRRRYRLLRNQLQATARKREGSVDEPSALETLDELRALAARIIADESNRNVARQILRDALRLRRADGVQSYQPLIDCREHASLILEELKDPRARLSHDVTAELANGKHPICHLLELVQRGSSEAEEQLDVAFASVERAFGRPLALAALTSKLRLSETPVAEPAPLVSPKPLTARDSKGPGIQLPLAAHAARLKSPSGLSESAAKLKRAVSRIGFLPPTPMSGPGAELCSPGSSPETANQPTHTTEADAAPTAHPYDLTSFKRRTLSHQQASSVFTAEPAPDPSSISPNQRTKCMADGGDVLSDVDLGAGSLTATAAAASRSKEITNPRAEGMPDDARPVNNCQVGDDSRLQNAVHRVWQLIGNDRLGLAFQLARCGEAVFAESWAGPPAEALRLAALNPLVRSSAGEVADAVTESFASLQAGWLTKVQRSIDASLLLFSAALRPALLVRRSGAELFLDLAVADQFPSLQPLGDVIRKYTHLGLELSPAILKGVREHAQWAEKEETSRRRCREWLDQNLHAQIIYAPTTNVWREWLDRGGIVGSVLQVVLQSQRQRREDARQQVERWSDRGFVNHHLNATDGQLRQRATRRRPIEARASEAIFRRMREAQGLVQEWLSLLDLEPDASGDFRYRQADTFRGQLLGHLDAARIEIAAHAASARPNTSPAIAALNAAQRTLTSLAALLDPNQPEDDTLLAVHNVLNGDLLRVAGVKLDGSWEPVADPEKILDALLLALNGPLETWEESFGRQLAAKDLGSAGLLIEQLERLGTFSADAVAGFRTRYEQRLEECRLELAAALDDLRMKIERAAIFSLINEADRAKYTADLDATRPDETVAFDVSLDAIGAIRREIDLRERQRVHEVRERLESSDIQSRDPAASDRIRRILEKGDYRVATEYLDHVERGEAIDEREDQRDLLADFFPEFPVAVHREWGATQGRLDRRTWNRFANAARRRERIGTFDYSRLTEIESKRMGHLFDNWPSVRGVQPPVATVAQVGEALLELIGFRGVKLVELAGAIPGSQVNFKLETVSLASRDECIVPQYGSLANGRYRLTCLWERSSVDQLVEMASKQGRESSSLIVLYFGNLDERQRRQLAASFRGNRDRRSALVIDESLMLFLCGQSERRLAALFHCAFSFTIADPYMTTASLVPVEMFFGRDRERQQILDRNGTCLVYGGRQLGKTALLRDVERRAYREGLSIVRWIDLKADGVGTAEDVWSTIASVLGSEGVLHDATRKQETIRARVAGWLSDNPERRIVLLLDEADALLDSDSADGYRVVSALKGMMDENDRRFKVVFAGLHNVQRTSRDINTPLAHLGVPVCVGPLLENGEQQEAVDLIRLPFETMGFRFESDDLVLRILSYTNYYPSLIQLLCKHLLEHVSTPRTAGFDQRKCPPYVITGRHVEDTYQKPRLRGEIRDRLMWTLDLDPRYRLIALCMAEECVRERSGGAVVRGFDAAEVRDMALYWWPKGFKEDATLEAFRTILDEMIGLGVLRKIGASQHYTFRSANTLDLLGRHADIESALQEAGEIPPSPIYVAATFRRRLGDGSSRRSPLTANQESEILGGGGVAIVHGSPLAGLADVPAALVHNRAQAHCEVFEERKLASFQMALETAVTRKCEVSVLLVQPSAVWDVTWVRHSIDVLRRRRSHSRITRVIFAAGPAESWIWQLGDEAQIAELHKTGLGEYSLRPWREAVVHHYLEDLKIGHIGTTGLSRVSQVTGNWGELLHRFGERCRDAPGSWDSHLADMETELRESRSVWRERALIPESLEPLSLMSEFLEPLDAEEIAAMCSGSTPTHVRRVIRWLDRMNYIRPEGEKWMADPTIASLLRTTDADEAA